MFLLQGNKQSGFSFDALATCVSSIITNGQIQVKIAKVLVKGRGNFAKQLGASAKWTSCAVARTQHCLV